MHFKNVKSTLHKAAALLLACLMLLSIGEFCTARAAEEDTIYNRLLKVKAVYPDKYFYFTVNGKASINSQNENCRLSLIPSRGGLPAGSEIGSKWEGWSCVGFARYVFYCVFGELERNATVVTSPSLGDVIHTTGPNSDHYSVFLREDANYWYVFDANWGNNCGVRWEGKIAKGRNTLHKVFHAKCYDSLPVGIETASCETHDWVPGLVVLNPTCAEPGEQIFTCAVCGETMIDEVPALEHTWDEGVDNNDGTVTYTCTECGESKTETYNGEIVLGSPKEYDPGDVDKDGAVTAGDARLALRYAVGLE